MERLVDDVMIQSELTPLQMHDICSKLIEYYNTGLEPDQIDKLALDFLSMKDISNNNVEIAIRCITDMAKENKEIKNERDYWEREAKKWCNQLGSLRKWLDDNDLDMDDILRKVTK